MSGDSNISRREVLDNVESSTKGAKPASTAGSEFTRRSALKSLGLGIAGLGEGINLLPLGEPTTMVELPKLKNGDQVEQWFKVPKKWNDQRTRARRVLNRQRSSLESHTGVAGSALVRSEQTYHGIHGLQIEVFVENEHHPKKNLPSKIDGVPVKQTEAPEIKAGGCSDPSGDCVNYDTVQGVAGGEELCWEQFGSIEGRATTTCRVTDDSDSEYMLNCSHLFWHDCEDADNGILNRKAVRRDGTEIGRVADYNLSEDWAVVDTSLGGSHFNYIDDNDDLPTVRGYVTKDTLDYWASISDEACLSKMGKTTGETRGRVYKTGGSFTEHSCTNMGNAGIWTYADLGQGDSGGPTWHWYNGYAYLVSCTGYYLYPHTNYFPCNGQEVGQDSAGVAAYRIADQGYYFGGSPNYVL